MEAAFDSKLDHPARCALCPPVHCCTYMLLCSSAANAAVESARLYQKLVYLPAASGGPEATALSTAIETFVSAAKAQRRVSLSTAPCWCDDP